MTQDEARARVASGAAHLDQVRPGWFNRIDTGTLTLWDPCGCIVGQLVPGTSFGQSFATALALLGIIRYDEREWILKDESDKDYGARISALGFDLMPTEAMCSAVVGRKRHQLLQDAWIEAIADRLLPTSVEGTKTNAGATSSCVGVTESAKEA